MELDNSNQDNENQKSWRTGGGGEHLLQPGDPRSRLRALLMHPSAWHPQTSVQRPGHLSWLLQARGAASLGVHTAGHQHGAGIAKDLAAECPPFPGRKPQLNLCANT